jgi:hypothetical protein
MNRLTFFHVLCPVQLTFFHRLTFFILEDEFVEESDGLLLFMQPSQIPFRISEIRWWRES